MCSWQVGLGIGPLFPFSTHQICLPVPPLTSLYSLPKIPHSTNITYFPLFPPSSPIFYQLAPSPSFYPFFSSLQHCSVPPPPTTRLVLFFLPTSPTPTFHPTISLPPLFPPPLLPSSLPTLPHTCSVPPTLMERIACVTSSPSSSSAVTSTTFLSPSFAAAPRHACMDKHTHTSL